MSCEKKVEHFLYESQVVLEEEIQKLAKQYNNWGKLLAPAPVAISILGQLILMSTQVRDFRIDNPPPIPGFKLVKYPNSFRATLVQISQSGHSAFRKAHTNMDEIRVLYDTVPSRVKDVVRYLLSKNHNVIKYRLYPTLDKISSVAEKSEKLSKAVVTEFEMVIELIDEVVVAAKSTQGGVEIKLDDVLFDRNLTEMERVFSEIETVLLEKKIYILRAMYDRLNHHQQNIMVRTWYGNENFTVDLSRPKETWLSQTEGRHERHKDAFFDRSWLRKYWFEDESVETNVCAEQNSQLLVEMLATFRRYREGYRKWQTTVNRIQSYSDEANLIVNTLERVSGNLKKCPDIVEIIDKLEKLMKVLKATNFAKINKTIPRPGTEEIEDINLLVNKVREAAKVTEKSKSNSTVYSGRNLMEVWSEVYQHQYEMVEEMANTTMKIIAINNQQMEIRREKTKRILDRIVNLNTTQIEYEQIMQALVDGMKELGNLKKNWGDLLNFFTNVNLFVKTATAQSVALYEIFDTLAQNVALLQDDGMFAELRRNIEKSNEAAFLVHGIAQMYVNVSDTYIMERVGSLNNMITMAREGATANEIEQEKKLLAANASIASKGIENFIREDEISLRAKLEEKHKEIRNEYSWIEYCRRSSEHEYPFMSFLNYNW